MVIILSIVVLGSTFGVIFIHDSDRDDKAPITIAPTVKQFDMPMVEIKGGSFIMGSDLNTDPDAEEDEAPRHQVTVSSFKMGKYLVTQSEWKQVMEDTKAQKSKNGKYPMINVTWEEVQTFISRLNEQTGRHFRLPTEAEWEYAARGGAKASNKGSIYSGGDDLKTMGWYADNSGNRPHPVGMLAPNALGLYDMSGNVWEYCSDWYGDYQAKKQTNPKGPATGDYHVIRGGSWNSSSHCCRITYRQDNSIISPTPDIGFRLVEE
ncbi:MAG: formylglycine-generating enzyme family protein [Prevotella sp.]|nr:formylglycine-generating enzyme family protein [Prevotella sp.]